MSGDINALDDASKRFKIVQEEKYINSVLSGHELHITTYVKDTETGEQLEVHKYKHKIPKSVPTWLTKHQLWHHTQNELEMLQAIAKKNGNRKPNNNDKPTNLIAV